MEDKEAKNNKTENNHQQRYEQLWSRVTIQKPESWSTWEVIKKFKEKKCLEIGPGKYPKIPLEGNFFIDLSQEAVSSLKKLDGKAFWGTAESLPFKDSLFDLVVATDVLEHIDNDKKAFTEISRVLKPGGFFLFSVPLRKELYDELDVIIGHKRRYEIKELIELLSKNNFRITKYREWSFYLKFLDFWARLLRTTRLFKISCQRANFFGWPKFLVNFLSKTYAFLDRKGAPTWQGDINKLENYRGKWIILLCQKKQIQ